MEKISKYWKFIMYKSDIKNEFITAKNNHSPVTLEVFDNMHSNINIDIYEYFMPSLA